MSRDPHGPNPFSDWNYRPETHVAPQTPPRARSPWPRRLVILLVIALVAGPTTAGCLPKEIARWYAAAALEKRFDGDLAGALESLDRGIDWDQESDELYRQRSEWRLEAKDATGGLDDASRAVQLGPQDPANYVQRSHALQCAGKRREAVDDWNTIIQLAHPQQEIVIQNFAGRAGVDVYNGRAYARALAKIELAEGLEDVQRAIRRLGPNAALLDTRGYLLYLLGDLGKARADLDSAVNEVEGQLTNWDAQQKRWLEENTDWRRLKYLREQLALTAAVIRYHRSLVCDQLHLTRQADADRRRVRELGYEPGDDLF